MKSLSLPLPAKYLDTMAEMSKQLIDYDIINIDITADAISCDVRFDLSDKTMIKDERAVVLIKRLKREIMKLRVEYERSKTAQNIAEHENRNLKNAIKNYEKANKVNIKVKVDNDIVCRSIVKNMNRNSESGQKIIITEKIREILMDHNITQKDFAKKYGVSSSRLGNILHGNSGTLKEIDKMLDFAEQICKEATNA